MSNGAVVRPSPFGALLRRSKFASYDPKIGQVYTSHGGHAHAHGHDHGHGHGTEDGHTHGVAHVGGISEADIRAAFASASASGENGNSGPIDMDTYAYVPFAHAKIWEMDMELFLAKATRK